jgi:hypothetical protein
MGRLLVSEVNSFFTHRAHKSDSLFGSIIRAVLSLVIISIKSCDDLTEFAIISIIKAPGFQGLAACLAANPKFPISGTNGFIKNFFTFNCVSLDGTLRLV